MSEIQRLLLVIAAAAIVGGIYFGFTHAVYDGTARCGTAFREDLESQIAATLGPDSFLPACDQALSDAKVLPKMMIGGGIVALIAVPIIAPIRKPVHSAA